MAFFLIKIPVRRMASNGFMLLAYMGELAVVANLAYLELKSLRYLGSAKKAAEETESTLHTTGANGNLALFADLFNQVKNLFSDDRTQRQAAWYIENPSLVPSKTYYNWCARWFFERFINDRDRTWSSIYLVLSGIIIVLMTVLSRFCIDEWEYSPQLWWVLFAALFFALAVPISYVFMGRRLKVVSEIITKNIRERKDLLAANTVVEAVTASQPNAIKAPLG